MLNFFILSILVEEVFLGPERTCTYRQGRSRYFNFLDPHVLFYCIYRLIKQKKKKKKGIISESGSEEKELDLVLKTHLGLIWFYSCKTGIWRLKLKCSFTVEKMGRTFRKKCVVDKLIMAEVLGPCLPCFDTVLERAS